MSSTRQRLIDTAFELFGRSDFHAVGLDRILEEVGVSKQTFYNHFESKDDLILAVLDHRHQTQDKYWSDLLQQIAGAIRVPSCMRCLTRWRRGFPNRIGAAASS